jgi:hypothetical protein
MEAEVRYQAKIKEVRKNLRIAKQFRKAAESQNHLRVRTKIQSGTTTPQLTTTTATPITFNTQPNSNY